MINPHGLLLHEFSIQKVIRNVILEKTFFFFCITTRKRLRRIDQLEPTMAVISSSNMCVPDCRQNF